MTGDSKFAGSGETAVPTRLREARTLAGLSQGQAAKLMAMHRPTVTEIEAGRRKVSAQELALFAKHYGVSLEWLTGAAPDNIDSTDPKVRLAARELAKLKSEDLDRVLHLLAALRNPR